MKVVVFSAALIVVLFLAARALALAGLAGLES